VILILGVRVQGVRVLVAEDNLINQMVAKKMLAALGATVSVVSNGEEAVARLCGTGADAEFDVVLMDMAMPQMDGLEATSELRRRGVAVPILAMTANVSDRDRATCQHSGMNGFLSKPILKGRLGRAIRQVIAKGSLFPPPWEPSNSCTDGGGATTAETDAQL
jgi:two-component system, sensor histidine kinase